MGSSQCLRLDPGGCHARRGRPAARARLGHRPSRPPGGAAVTGGGPRRRLGAHRGCGDPRPCPRADLASLGVGGHRRPDRRLEPSGAPGRRPRTGARATDDAVEPGRVDDPGRWPGRGRHRAGRSDPVRPARPRLPRAGLRRNLPPQRGGGHPRGWQRLHAGGPVRPLLRSCRLLPHGLARDPGAGAGRPGPGQYRRGPGPDRGDLAAEPPGTARPGHRPRLRL